MDAGGGRDDGSFSGVDSDDVTDQEVTVGVTYTLSELVGRRATTTRTWACTGDTDGRHVAGPDPLGYGESVECTITNTAIAPTLTLVKAVAGSDVDPSEWTLAADGTTGSFSGAGTSDDVTDQEATAGVTYTLSESGGPSGHDDSDWVCTVTGRHTSPDQTAAGYGESVECTITNTAIAPTSTWSRRSGQ